MRRTKILNADEVRRKPFSEAKNEFVKHCRIKNLRPKTITYYEEDIHYFHMQTKARYVDEITQEKFDDFIIGELDKGKKGTYVLLPQQNFNAYFGNTNFSQRWVGALNGRLIEKKVLDGVSKYKVLHQLSSATDSRRAASPVVEFGKE